MRYIFRHALIGALCSLLLPLSAHAQAGKRPDPNSPAGVEYQLPLDQARKNATGGGGQSGGGGGDSARRSARLFGVGIVAAKAGSSDESGGSSDSRAPGATGASGGGDGSGDAEPGGGDAKRADGSGPTLTPSALPSPGDDGASASLQIAAIVLAVLLLGGLLGLFLRRGLRESGS